MDRRSTTVDLAHFTSLLTAAEQAREQQLSSLPALPGDLVADAHRASVTRILAEIRAALGRIEQGSYGTCARCGSTIPVERLELRPWTALCVHCAW
jgi:DnaK suppressor protein